MTIGFKQMPDLEKQKPPEGGIAGEQTGVEAPDSEKPQPPEETIGGEAEGEVSEKKESEKSKRALELLMELFDAGQVDRPGSNPFGRGLSEECSGAKEELKRIFEEEGIDQEGLAQNFFDDTIGQGIKNNNGAYKVYKMLKGTRFADKFRELEDQRLKEAGYENGFTL